MLARLGDASRESVRRALAAGACAVDGVRRHYGYRVEAGAAVELAGWARITEVRAEAIELRVLYEDDELIAIDKPAGMLAHPTSRERTGTVINALKGMGYRVVEIPVNHRPRVAGVSKYGFGNRALKATLDMFAVRWMLSRQLKIRVRPSRELSECDAPLRS